MLGTRGGATAVWRGPNSWPRILPKCSTTPNSITVLIRISGRRGPSWRSLFSRFSGSCLHVSAPYIIRHHIAYVPCDRISFGTHLTTLRLVLPQRCRLVHRSTRSVLKPSLPIEGERSSIELATLSRAAGWRINLEIEPKRATDPESYRELRPLKLKFASSFGFTVEAHQFSASIVKSLM